MTIRTVVLSDKRLARNAVRLDFNLEDVRDRITTGQPINFQAWPLNGTASLALLDLRCQYAVNVQEIRDRQPDEPIGRVDGQHPRTGDPQPATDFFQYQPAAFIRRFTTDIVEKMLAEEHA